MQPIELPSKVRPGDHIWINGHHFVCVATDDETPPLTPDTEYAYRWRPKKSRGTLADAFRAIARRYGWDVFGRDR